MKDTRSIAIAVLAVSATILSTVLVLSFVAVGPARADSAIGAGDYIMVAGQYSSGKDFLYVFDLQKRGVNVYGYDRPDNRIQLLRSIELRKLFRTEGARNSR